MNINIIKYKFLELEIIHFIKRSCKYLKNQNNTDKLIIECRYHNINNNNNNND